LPFFFLSQLFFSWSLIFCATAVDDLSLNSEYYEPVANCRLCLVAAGMPRSGSTIQYDTLDRIVRHLGFKSKKIYWNAHIHDHKTGEEARRHARATNAALRALSPDTVVLVKSHVRVRMVHHWGNQRHKVVGRPRPGFVPL
jgi:hypothetical protein